MKVQTSNELARMVLLQRQTTTTRNALDRAAQEMSTGLKADKYKATGGNLARLFSLERMLERNAVHASTINLTETRVDVMQLGLGQVQAAVEGVAVDMLAAVGRSDIGSARTHAERALRGLEDTVRLLNGNVGGQSLYAGIATERPALVAASEILAQIESRITSLDAADAVAAIGDYFAGIGTPTFEADAYLGAAKDLSAAEVGDGIRLQYAVRATDPALVEALKGFATAALVAAGSFAAAPPEDQLALLQAAGETLVAARGEILDVRARVGAVQESLEVAKAQRQAERESFEMARTSIVGADTYEAATVFQAMQTQLESVFTVTARLAQLRFANFMR